MTDDYTLGCGRGYKQGYTAGIEWAGEVYGDSKAESIKDDVIKDGILADIAFRLSSFIESDDYQLGFFFGYGYGFEDGYWMMRP